MTKRGSDELFGQLEVGGGLGGVSHKMLSSSNNTNGGGNQSLIGGNPNGAISPRQQQQQQQQQQQMSSIGLDSNEHKKVKLESLNNGGEAGGGSGDVGGGVGGVGVLPSSSSSSSNTGGGSGSGNSVGCLLSSRVVHIRNIGVEVNEEDLISFGLPFGKVTNILLLKGKSQAFIEFGELIYAHNLINYYLNTGQQPTIKSKPVYIQFSNHKQLKTTNNNNNTTGGVYETEEEQELLSSSSYNNTNTTTTSIGGNFGSTGVNLGGSPVLRIIIENLVYPVNLDTLYSIFARFGKILKIVTFTKGGAFQSLIEFDSSIQASQAKLSLDGQQMFTSGNLLKIQFSKLQQLNVKYNNDKSRDYTNPLLPSGNGHNNSSNSTSSSSLYHHQHHHHHHTSNSESNSPTPPPVPPHLSHYSHFNPHHHHHDSLFDPLTFAAFQGAPGFGLPTSFASLRAALSGSSSSGSTNMNATPNLSSVSHHSHSSHSGAMAYNSVLLVSNLNDQMATPDALFTLFGVYGDVIRVKILFNKKDNALIQMLDPQQAQIAMTYLDKVKVFGKTIKVSPSKHSLVQMPKEGQPDSGLTKDFTNSPLHRFKKPGSKNYLNIYPPSPTLHLSNIPSSITEDHIRDAFLREANLHIINFKFFPKDRKMALVQLETVEDAIHALIKMHNYQLSESNHLRVSFSKSSI